MSKPRPLIAGNWKMNGRRADGLALAEAIRAGAGSLAAELLLCPPATLIAQVGEKIKGSGIALGGQDCHWAASGAHTGDIAAPMLADLGCRYVIVGHSERRHGHGETDALVRAKAEAALAAGLIAIVCLGETEADRFRLLYGGSVKPNNCEDILGLANVDGALVGGASLKELDFLTIARTCD